jgi:DNA mismatch repair protein MutS2
MLQLFPENTSEKLEFNQIISLLAENCVSELGVEHFSNNEFYTNAETIRFKFKQISEFNDIRLNNFNFPLDNYLDGRDILKRLEIEGTVLTPEDLFVLKKILNTTVRIFDFFKKYPEKYTYLKTLINELYNPDNEFYILDKVFDDEGFVYDNASPKLKEIRNKIRVTENQAERVFGKLLEKYKKQGWISDEEQSVRQGERVLSIQSKFKRNIDGIIVDLSSTGRSTYIQPSEIMQLKNKVFELKQEEKQEVFRICRELTEQLRNIKEELKTYFYLFEELDVIQAKERLLRNYNGSCPKVTDGASMLLNNGFHPLLFLKKQSKKN